MMDPGSWTVPHVLHCRKSRMPVCARCARRSISCRTWLKVKTKRASWSSSVATGAWWSTRLSLSLHRVQVLPSHFNSLCYLLFLFFKYEITEQCLSVYSRLIYRLHLAAQLLCLANQDDTKTNTLLECFHVCVVCLQEGTAQHWMRLTLKKWSHHYQIWIVWVLFIIIYCSALIQGITFWFLETQHEYIPG